MSSSLIPLGASVVAKWPSTSNYYKARVIDYTDDQNYVCQFLDGSIIALPSKYVDSPEKFQRTTKKISFMHNEQMLLDPAFSFQSTSVSLLWIGIFLYIQHWFHHYHPDRDGSPTYSLLQQYPNAAARYLLGWFGLQLICARYFPHTGSEQLIYIKESQPSIYYKHRSNSLLAFATIGLMMILFREQIPVRELTKSYYLLALFSLGIALTFSIVLLTNRFFSHAGALCVVECVSLSGMNVDHEFHLRNGRLHQQDTPFDFHLFLSIRPGIVLWPALNLLLLLTIVQYNRQVSIRFVLSILFQTIYILNVFINETSMIRQSLDISPPSSFDALFTNLCWVPFTATLTSVGLLVGVC